MSCEYCQTLVIGKIYNSIGVVFTECCYAEIDTEGNQQKYMLYDDAFHWFRVLHSYRCSSCNKIVKYIAFPCHDYDIGIFAKASADLDRIIEE